MLARDLCSLSTPESCRCWLWSVQPVHPLPPPTPVQVLDVIDAGASGLVVAPTSSGKTFMSAYCINRVVAAGEDPSGVVVFVAPNKALCNQVAAQVRGVPCRGEREWVGGGREGWGGRWMCAAAANPPSLFSASPACCHVDVFARRYTPTSPGCLPCRCMPTSQTSCWGSSPGTIGELARRACAPPAAHAQAPPAQVPPGKQGPCCLLPPSRLPPGAHCLLVHTAVNVPSCTPSPVGKRWKQPGSW